MSTIKILSWNVNGIRAAHRKGFMNWLDEYNPDIICIQETKAQVAQIPEEIANTGSYDTYWAQAEKRGYSGVGIMSKIESGNVWRGMGSEMLDNEGRILFADFGDFILGSVYFPNGKASKERLKYKMTFYEKFLEYIDALKSKGRNIIICGDVNTAHKEIDLSNPKANEKTSGFLPIERAWIDKLIEHGFIDTFRIFNQKPNNYSWWDLRTRARERNVGWRLDYFFVDEDFITKVKDGFILHEVMGSDHCPVGIELEM